VQCQKKTSARMLSSTTRKHTRNLIGAKHGTVTTNAEDGAKKRCVLRESLDRAKHVAASRAQIDSRRRLHTPNRSPSHVKCLRTPDARLDPVGLRPPRISKSGCADRLLRPTSLWVFGFPTIIGAETYAKPRRFSGHRSHRDDVAAAAHFGAEDGWSYCGGRRSGLAGSVARPRAKSRSPLETPSTRAAASNARVARSPRVWSSAAKPAPRWAL
jgi:hypothetical protein